MTYRSLRSAAVRLRRLAAWACCRSTDPRDGPDRAPGADADRYRSALDALPSATRRVFLLHRAHGLDLATIARRTGQPPAAVEQHLADAILALAKALDAASD